MSYSHHVPQEVRCGGSAVDCALLPPGTQSTVVISVEVSEEIAALLYWHSIQSVQSEAVHQTVRQSINRVSLLARIHLIIRSVLISQDHFLILADGCTALVSDYSGSR